MMRFTTDDVMALKPCADWSRERVAALVGDDFHARDVLAAVKDDRVDLYSAVWLLSRLMDPADLPLAACGVMAYTVQVYESAWPDPAASMADIYRFHTAVLAGENFDVSGCTAPVSYIDGIPTTTYVMAVLTETPICVRDSRDLATWIVENLVDWIDRPAESRAALTPPEPGSPEWCSGVMSMLL